MPYLTLNDYLLKIQFRDLDQILSGMDSLRVSTERASITRIKSRLVQKYDVAAEFKDTKKFCISDAYDAGQLVYLDADAYTQRAYNPGELTLYLNNVYSCSGGIAVAEAFNAAHWELVGARYAYFCVTDPCEPFNIYENYKIGDIRFYKNKIYTCKIPSDSQSHQSDLQAKNTYDIPLINYFPDTPQGARQWGNGVNYKITGILPTDTKYTEGDNRNAELVEIAIYLTIYKLSPRISPNNIPDIWVKNFDDSEKWLQDLAKGNATLDLPLLQPRQGASIRMGSEVKRINNY